MKACPFCGSASKMQVANGYRAGVWARARCANRDCGATGPKVSEHMDWRSTVEQLREQKQRVRAQAARAWDSRTM